MIRIAVVNQKGGVGKTTTSINLATALAAVQRRVLLIDFDPQGNTSTGLGIAREMRDRSSYELLIGSRSLDEVARTSSVPGLHVVPATPDLAGAEIELVAAEDRITSLKSALDGSPSAWDVCLIDCPPSLGLLTANALVACDALIVPLQCEFFALEGLSQLLKTVERLKQSMNTRLEIMGVVLTMYDRRNKLSEQVAEDVRSCLGDLVFDTVIPRNVRLSEAPSFGLPALIYDHKAPGSMAYIELAREVLARLPIHRGLAA